MGLNFFRVNRVNCLKDSSLNCNPAFRILKNRNDSLLQLPNVYRT